MIPFLRFRIWADSELVSDETIEGTIASVELGERLGGAQGDVARAALDAGKTVVLMVDDEDGKVWHEAMISPR